MSEQVILVDKDDAAIGTCEKIKAHQEALLHRAFSIFIFRQNNNILELLIQKRATAKYHCPNLWTNTCCSHPKPNETILEAAKRRLQEEFGFTTALKEINKFHYTAACANGLTENEIDHVLIGFADHITAKPNPAEISTYKWVPIYWLKQDLATNIGNYTPWFARALTMALCSLTIQTQDEI